MFKYKTFKYNDKELNEFLNEKTIKQIIFVNESPFIKQDEMSVNLLHAESSLFESIYNNKKVIFDEWIKCDQPKLLLKVPNEFLEKIKEIYEGMCLFSCSTNVSNKNIKKMNSSVL